MYKAQPVQLGFVVVVVVVVVVVDFVHGSGCGGKKTVFQFGSYFVLTVNTFVRISSV